ncbi:hypothetical protein GCM10007103_07540 [Salinimicrobium marinum]|uniref:M23ase beta-sheet core domain-containing protein n=1 Tax=Salinimicrobium marinum TaxID=680283 RepID=A0A918S9V9_9FLAO|nr:peptidoglycan DD-metalloendopeptidase family protein [Salinimicrobium marinum]GHA28420.1 hypothetical protein GCM10007103_07540 [Salinimicrobium marinum]
MIASNFPQFLSGLTSEFTPVIDSSYLQEDYMHIDLSGTNKELSEVDISSSEDFSVYIREYLQKHGKKVAFGGYNEVRDLYRRSELFSASEGEEMERNIHIGLDIWAEAGTAVLAVMEGKVHSFQDNATFGDYGPTIILEHHISGKTYFSLYGHLSKHSLQQISVGKEVKQGEKLATLGKPSENGDYAPHLHFQLMGNLQGKKGDYPGVTSLKELDFYLLNCPDPNLLLKIKK